MHVTDREVTHTLETLPEPPTLLYATRRICGFEAKHNGWLLNFYIGTYPLGEFLEGTATQGDLVLRLTPDQIRCVRTKLPDPIPYAPYAP